MTQLNQRPRMAGGIFLALGPIGGAIVGSLLGQPSAGFLAGLVLGVAAALLVWLARR